MTLTKEQLEGRKASIAGCLSVGGLIEKDYIDTIEAAWRERDNWKDDVEMWTCNTNYYRTLLEEIGCLLGDEVYIADDGSRSERPLLLKIPRLVQTLRLGLDELRLRCTLNSDVPTLLQTIERLANDNVAYFNAITVRDAEIAVLKRQLAEAREALRAEHTEQTLNRGQ